jgi:hypothetical protein
MQGTKVIRVYPEGLKKLDKINSERPQDMSRADTFEYILRVYEEYINEKKANQKKERGINPIPAKHAPGSATQPAIIDAENLQNKRYADSKRSIAERIRKGENKND